MCVSLRPPDSWHPKLKLNVIITVRNTPSKGKLVHELAYNKHAFFVTLLSDSSAISKMLPKLI